MRKLKRGLAGCLAGLLFVLSPAAVFVPARRVEAVTVEATVEFAARTVLSVASSLAALGTGQYAVFAANTAVYHSYVQDWLESGDITVNEDTGEMTVSETARKQVWTWISTSETTNVGWYYLYPNASARSWYYNQCVSWGKVPYYNLVQPHLFFYTSRSGSSRSDSLYYDISGSGVYYVREKSSNAAMYAYDSSLTCAKTFKVYNSLDPQYVYEKGSYSYNTCYLKDSFSVPGTYYTEAAYIGNLPVKCWINTGCLKLALANGDGYESYINSTAPSGDVVLNVDKVENTDWEVVNNQLYQNILEEVTEVGKDAITEDQLQEIIAEQTGKVEDAIEDGTKDIVAAIDDEVKWLKKINTQLTDLNDTVKDGFNNISELIGNQGGTSVAFSSEEIVAAITQLQSALLADNQEFNEQTSQLIARCEELLNAVESGNDYVAADLQTIKELMQDIVNNTGDEESSINVKVAEISEFLELMQIDIEKLTENVLKLDMELLDDLITKMVTGTDKHSELLEDILEESKKSNALLTASLLTELFQTIMDGEDDASLIDDLTTTFYPVAETASEKFPFSLPKDLYDIVQLLDAEPQVPKFTLPLKFEMFTHKIDYEIDIDLTPLEPLAEIVRNGLKLLFLISLVWMSWHSTNGGGGGNEGGGAS